MNTNQENSRYYEILNGPSKDTIFDACKYARVNGAKIPVSFDVVLGYTKPKGVASSAWIAMAVTDFQIMGIENEDSSGESFNLWGYCLKEGEPKRFRAYFNAKHRKGTISFSE